MPDRITLPRAKGWKMPEGAVTLCLTHWCERHGMVSKHHTCILTDKGMRGCFCGWMAQRNPPTPRCPDCMSGKIKGWKGQT